MTASDLSIPGTMRAPRQPGHTVTGHPRAVVVWLFACCAAVAIMVVIGGATRLTDSGLSIAEWKPLMGTLPPLSDAEWQRVFDLYRGTSEYQLVNAGMDLAGFKTIFWWEYVHRLWGRLIGLVFIVPLAWFAWRGWLRDGLGWRLLGIFALGGIQGAIGWWMVASGLTGRVDVSPYRLTVHLSIALVLYGLLLWTALNLVAGPARPVGAGLRRAARGMMAMVALTILAGAFVAGTKAGFVYNTFPLMDGQIVPPDYGHLSPFLLNLFENPAAVQFNHRLIAVATVLAAAAFFWQARREPALSRPALLLLVAVCGQMLIGIATLVLVVPLPLGIAHQAGALAVLTAAVWVLHRTRQAAA